LADKVHGVDPGRCALEIALGEAADFVGGGLEHGSSGGIILGGSFCTAEALAQVVGAVLVSDC
jgi:hypothetical protein